MKKMLDWLTHLLWISEGIFLAASTPHIATYFAHFDNPTDFWGTIYAWGVGYGLALTIDGVSFVVLMSLIVAIKYKRSGLLVTFLVCALLLISGLSWFINWQYNIVFASSMFAKADGIITFNGLSIGTLNPIIGGAFPLLSVLYAVVAKAIEVDEGALIKTAMTPEQFENEKLRLAQEQELKSLKASQGSGKGLLSLAQETVMGKSRDADELLNLTLSYLRDARELLLIESEERALEALSRHLKINAKTTLPLLIQARSIIDKEDHEERMRRDKADREERLRQEKVEEERRLEQSKSEVEEVNPQSKETQVDLLEGLQGNDTVPLETVAEILGYDARYVTRLRNEGKLKHTSKRPDRITVASLRVYQANHKRRASSASRPERDADPLTVTNGHKRVTQPLDNLVRMEV